MSVGAGRVLTMAATSRQFEILRLLRVPEGVSLLALSRRLSVAKNTIQRDIDSLCNARVGITHHQQGQTVLYWLSDAATAPQVQPAPDAATLAPVLAALRPWRRSGWVRALLSRLALPQDAWSAFDSASPEPVVPGGELVLREVVTGLLEHRQVRLTYRHRGSEQKTRVTVEPARLRFAAGLPYLDARTVPGGEVRTFAVHRLVEVRASKKRFKSRPLPERHAFGAVEGEPVEVVVKFDATVAEYIAERRWHPSQKLEHATDGSLVFRATVSGEHEFIGWVLSWAPWAELVAPAAWRKGVKERVKALAAKHR